MIDVQLALLILFSSYAGAGSALIERFIDEFEVDFPTLQDIRITTSIPVLLLGLGVLTTTDSWLMVFVYGVFFISTFSVSHRELQKMKRES